MRRAPALALACLSIACSAEYQTPRTPEAGRAHVRVLSYNVNYGIAGDEPTVEAIRSAEADVAFLQETTPEWEQALRPAFDGSYPHMEFRHCCGAGGLAVLSRYPFAEEAYVDPPAGGWFPGWVVTVDSPLGKLQVLQVHLRPQISDGGSVVSGYFGTPPIRESQIKHFAKHLDTSLPTLIVGDFNEEPDGRALSYLSELGYRSALPAFAGSEPTWRWPTSLFTLRQQLDHIVVDPKIDVLDARVFEQGRSDHLPVVAVVQLR